MPGTFQLWNGKFLLGQNGKMAVHPACCCVDDGPLNCLCGDLIVRIDGAGAANYGCDDAECSQLNGEWRLSLTLSRPTHCEWRAYHGVCEYPGQGYIIADLYKDWLPWYGPLPGYGYFKIVVQHEHNPPYSQHWSLIGEYGFEHEGVTCADLLEFPLTITRIIGTNTLCGGDDYNITLLRWEDSPLP